MSDAQLKALWPATIRRISRIRAGRAAQGMTTVHIWRWIVVARPWNPLANKLAPIAWAILRHQEVFRDEPAVAQ